MKKYKICHFDVDKINKALDKLPLWEPPKEMENLIEALANSVSEDENEAEKYLREQGYDPEKIGQEGLELINKLRKDTNGGSSVPPQNNSL